MVGPDFPDLVPRVVILITGPFWTREVVILIALLLQKYPRTNRYDEKNK